MTTSDAAVDTTTEVPHEPVLLTPRMVGEVNRSRVVQSLFDHGPTSRAELARLAGVPRATIGALLQGLIDDGLLEELEAMHVSGQVGKPGRPLWFRERSALSICVTFEDERVRAALINARGELLDQASCPLDTPSASTLDLLRAVRSGIDHVWPTEEVMGIGIAVPGIVGPHGFVRGARRLPGARGTVLAEDLVVAYGVPVHIDNDAHVRALGEKWFGDGRSISTFAAVQTGLHLGVGLVLQGTIFRGEDGVGGFLAHVCVDPVGETCRCGLRGCWQTVASLDWLRGRADLLELPGATTLDSAALLDLVEDPEHGTAARELMWAYVDNVARGLSTLVQLMGTRHLLLHGDLVSGGEEMRGMVEHATRERCLPQLRDHIHVRLSSAAADAALLGAAGLVLSEAFALVV